MNKDSSLRIGFVKDHTGKNVFCKQTPMGFCGGGTRELHIQSRNGNVELGGTQKVRTPKMKERDKELKSHSDCSLMIFQYVTNWNPLITMLVLVLLAALQFSTYSHAILVIMFLVWKYSK